MFWHSRFTGDPRPATRDPRKNQIKFFFALFFRGPRSAVRGTPRGFSLIEVLVAIVILSTGLVLVVEGMGWTEQAVRVSQNFMTAAQIGEKKIAESEVELLERHHLSMSSDHGDEKFPGRKFVWSKTVDSYEDSTLEDKTKLNQVEVSVAWKEGGREKNLSFATLLLNREKRQ